MSCIKNLWVTNTVYFPVEPSRILFEYSFNQVNHSFLLQRLFLSEQVFLHVTHLFNMGLKILNFDGLFPIFPCLAVFCIRSSIQAIIYKSGDSLAIKIAFNPNWRRTPSDMWVMYKDYQEELSLTKDFLNVLHWMSHTPRARLSSEEGIQQTETLVSSHRPSRLEEDWVRSRHLELA